MTQKHEDSWGLLVHSWIKCAFLCWAVFFTISWAVERQAKRRMRKLYKQRGIMGRWRNFRRTRRSGETRRSFV